MLDDGFLRLPCLSIDASDAPVVFAVVCVWLVTFQLIVFVCLLCGGLVHPLIALSLVSG